MQASYTHSARYCFLADRSLRNRSRSRGRRAGSLTLRRAAPLGLPRNKTRLPALAHRHAGCFECDSPPALAKVAENDALNGLVKQLKAQIGPVTAQLSQLQVRHADESAVLLLLGCHKVPLVRAEAVTC